MAASTACVPRLHQAAGPTGWRLPCWRCVALIAALDVPRLRARLGRLHPRAIRRPAALALHARAFSDTRALSFVNLYLYGGGFDMAAALLAKMLPFDLFETRRLRRRRRRA